MALRTKGVSAAKQHSSIWGLSAAGLVTGATVALLLYAPATWLCAGVEAASRGHVRLMQAQGSVWQGSAALVLAGPEGGTAAMTWPSRWHWEIKPSWRGVQLQLYAACCMPSPVDLHITPSGLHINAATFKMPMALLQGLGSPWNTLQLQGDLQLDWQAVQVRWSNAPITWDTKMQVRALRVSSRLSTLPQVGSYQFDIEGGSTPRLKLVTLQGPLHLEGQGNAIDNRWRFDGQAHAQPEQAQALANLLNLLGERSGQKTRIRWG